MSEDAVLKYLQTEARKEPQIKTLILYGSRARGDNRSNSDYDIAVVAPKWTHEDWSRWGVRVKEEIPTLCGVDLTHLTDKVSKDLRQAILSEGKSFYEKK